MIINNNDLFIWHPIGPHNKESVEEIFNRKIENIYEYGYTMWSFSPIKQKRANFWLEEINKIKQNKLYVICCPSNKTIDPALNVNKEPKWLKEVSFDGYKWKSIPSKMASYHKDINKNGVIASTFNIKNIISLKNSKIKRPNKWFNVSKEKWINSTLPTRGEFLVSSLEEDKDGKNIPFLLELEYPYFGWLR